MRRRLPLLVTGLVGLAAVLVAAVGLATDRAVPPDFGNPVAATHTSRPSEPARPTNPTTPTRPTPAPAMAVELVIPALAVHAAITPVDDQSGQLMVPANPATVGWWTGGALPGSSSGTVVLDGHVDEAKVGPGALFNLTTLQPGDVITLITDDHRQLAYTVTARRVYPKAPGLPADLFTTTGPARLMLITCGGPFDRVTQSYRDNIAVFAVPTTP